MAEHDVITHLIHVERMAYDMLLDAQTEADKRKLNAKDTAEKEYLVAYEGKIQEFEHNFETQKKYFNDSRDEQYDVFKKELSSIELDTASFDSFLTDYFFGS